MHEVQELIREQLKDQATKQLRCVAIPFSNAIGMMTPHRSHIQDEIKHELVRQVREQVELQIKEHIPVPLEEQKRGTKRQLIEVKHALMNS